MSQIKYLLDEHVSRLYQRELHRREPMITVWKIGEPDAPRVGTPDPMLLIWCEEQNFILVTNNRRSIPDHLSDHLASGKHVPGIFILNRRLSIGDTLEELILVWGAGDPREYHDTITYLPVS